MDIYIPKTELIVPQRLRVGVAAFIGWRVRKRSTGRVVREAEPYKNMITDAGLDAWGGTSDDDIADLTEVCAVGTGTTEPAAGDTALVSESASTSSRTHVASGVQTSTLPYYGYVQYSYQFSEGSAQGNQSELGFRPSGGNLFSRQLFRDGEGSPTTITVLSDEFLEVTYEVRKYLPNPVDLVQDPVTISGSDYEVTTRPISVVTGGSQWSYEDGYALAPPVGVNSQMRTDDEGLQPITGTYDVVLGNTDSNSMSSYTAGTRTRSVEGVWNPGTATGDIARVCWGKMSGSTNIPHYRWAQWQTAFNPPLPKTSDNRLVLQFYAQWGREGEI